MSYQLTISTPLISHIAKNFIVSDPIERSVKTDNNGAIPVGIFQNFTEEFLSKFRQNEFVPSPFVKNLKFLPVENLEIKLMSSNWEIPVPESGNFDKLFVNQYVPIKRPILDKLHIVTNQPNAELVVSFRSVYECPTYPSIELDYLIDVIMPLTTDKYLYMHNSIGLSEIADKYFGKEIIIMNREKYDIVEDFETEIFLFKTDKKIDNFPFRLVETVNLDEYKREGWYVYQIYREERIDIVCWLLDNDIKHFETIAIISKVDEKQSKTKNVELTKIQYASLHKYFYGEFPGAEIDIIFKSNKIYCGDTKMYYSIPVDT